MEMQMVNTANFPSGSMARSTTAAQMQDAVMDSSGAPQPKTLMQMGNMDFVPMSVSRSMFLLFFFLEDCSLLLCLSTSSCAYPLLLVLIPLPSLSDKGMNVFQKSQHTSICTKLLEVHEN